MTGTNVDAEQQNKVDPHWGEVDKIVAGGWDVVNERIRLTSERLIELAANIYVHRKPAMTMLEQRDSGLLSLNLNTHIDDFVKLVSGFRPPKRSVFELNHPEFRLPFDSVRKEFPSGELLKRHIKAIDSALFALVDAVEAIAERPRMPVPTFEQLATGYIEMARLKGIQSAVQTAASADLSSSALSEVDLFGVGPTAAPIISRIIPPRCVPSTSRITLPAEVSIDHVVAGHLLDRFVMSGKVHFETLADDAFDAALTHIENHAVVAVGATPFHSPKSLCFDNRAFDQSITNTELVIARAIEQGTPLDFTDGIVRFAQGDNLNEYQFETDIIKAFLEACGSTSQAMQATNLLLTNRFKISETFREWLEKRSREYFESLPEYQKRAPKI